MTSINGLPLHPLLVHFVVVLLPLAAICAVLSVVWPTARRKLGVITPILALVALVLVPLTTSAGESLEQKVPPNALVENHAELGDQALIWAAPLFVFAAIWWALHHKWTESRLDGLDARARSGVTVLTGLVLLIFALGSMVMVYRIGESGAQAVWHAGT
ncbi:DUF2231 domain-containing protein [Nocardia sp. 348MFTsu5.1]|uniref:DUF2231 domain-containing protein n=1 Tax=Nocardia sp. 348MFTsu5.1 TaxID=1172185 RepID=UPI000362A246|nr:DUF2231 domain-containing protein [Nocardia sp. 348MFTsu5.1]